MPVVKVTQSTPAGSHGPRDIVAALRGHPPTLSENNREMGLLHCAISLEAQCIVIGPVCGFVCVYVGLLP